MRVNLYAQCGHFFSRVAYSTRWNEENAHCQCASCNIKHEHCPWPFTKWMLEMFGQEKIDELQRVWNKPKRFLDYELEEMEVVYREKLNEQVATE